MGKFGLISLTSQQHVESIPGPSNAAVAGRCHGRLESGGGGGRGDGGSGMEGGIGGGGGSGGPTPCSVPGLVMTVT